MRLTALLPAACSAAALILTFLCLFAGHKQGFMEDYHMLTLNTSLLGETLLDTTPSSSNPLSNILNLIPDSVTNTINAQLDALKQRLGIHDFYSAHLLTYCSGSYIPTALPNTTVSASEIHKNVTECSKEKAMYTFNPTQILENALNRTTGIRVSLADLKWPDEIEDGVDALNGVMRASFVLFVLAIAFSFLSLLSSLLALLSPRRSLTLVNLFIATLAFLATALASALVTAVAVKGANVITQYGKEIGVVAYWGGKFLALGWAAAGVLIVCVVWWAGECCFGRGRGRREGMKVG